MCVCVSVSTWASQLIKEEGRKLKEIKEKLYRRVCEEEEKEEIL